MVQPSRSCQSRITWRRWPLNGKRQKSGKERRSSGRPKQNKDLTRSDSDAPLVDIAAEFSRTGQIVLLVLVEVGCLGLMTCGTFLLIAIGRRLSLAREFSLMNAYGVAQIQGLKGLICWTVGSMLAVEGIGAALLYLRIGDVYRSIFYSAMSFCNAGFSVDPGSIAVFAGDPWVVFILAAETILGGIGFLVLYNFCTCFLGRRHGAPRGKLSLHARVVLRLTAYLLVLAFAFFLVAEWNGALAPYHGAQRWWVAFYQAVTPRTCGFCIIPTESLRPITRLVYEALMFVGGAPGSAAAGMKVTTFAVLVYTLLAMCRGEQETTLDHRIVPAEIVRESIVIFMALVGFIVLVTGALFITEDMSADTPERLFFEAVSAVTTTGPSSSRPSPPSPLPDSPSPTPPRASPSPDAASSWSPCSSAASARFRWLC